MKPRVLYYTMLNFVDENMQLLERSFDVVRLETPDQDTPEILRDLDGLFAPMRYYCGPEKMDACPKLKVIGSSTTGAPHIDLEYARTKGIQVAYLRYETDFLRTITPTAELTWGLVIALTRRIPAAYQAVLGGQWNRRDWPSPRMLSRMELGIVGLGRLGTMTARYGKAFGMTVRYHDPYVSRSEVQDVERVASLADLVAQSDIVCLHMHLNEETSGIINREVLARFRRGSYLVNTARGALVETDALVAALESGHLAGAATDVLDDEFERAFDGDVARHPLVTYARAHENLLITPHIGGSTLDAWRETQTHTIRMMTETFAKSR